MTSKTEVSSLGGDGSLSDALGLNYIQISNFSITGSGTSIKDVIFRDQTSFKLILDARFGFSIENNIRFSREFRFLPKIYKILQRDKTICPKI